MFTRKQLIKVFKREYKHRIALFRKHCNCVVDFVENRHEELIMAMLESKDARWLDWEKELIKELLNKASR